MDRPTVIQCDTCGVDVDVHPQGTIPKYCKDHRGVMARKAYYAAQEPAKDEPPDWADEAVHDPGEVLAPFARVCRAPSCSIPLHDAWLNEWCPNHWRIITVETRGELLSTMGTDAYDKAVFHAVREIGKYEGRAAFVAQQFE